MKSNQTKTESRNKTRNTGEKEQEEDLGKIELNGEENEEFGTLDGREPPRVGRGTLARLALALPLLFPPSAVGAYHHSLFFLLLSRLSFLVPAPTTFHQHYCLRLDLGHHWFHPPEDLASISRRSRAPSTLHKELAAYIRAFEQLQHSYLPNPGIMATSDYSNPESLDVLATTVNQTMVETGRFFKSKGSSQNSAQLKRAVPVAQEQFQSALDNLSEQIFIAKAFLERDYEVVKARKAALRPVEDVVKNEPIVKQEPEAAPQPRESAEEPGKTEIRREQDSPSSQPPSTAEVPQPAPTQTPVKTEKPDEPKSTAPDQNLSGPTDVNFDSVLNDTTGGANEFDLNLDFGDDDIGNETFLAGSNMDSKNAGVTGQGKGNHLPGNETTDLPGTENPNANLPAGGDAFDLELQKAEAFSGADGAQDGMFGGGTDDMMVPGESSFDDLFMESENFGGEGDGDPGLLEGDRLMNINEIDDNWFT
ncbi:uncharacterized protein KD926_006340 [Aspergillus affinis]|uniref:uncharacterized protein n=1 Tax=Aspergillus affinis TaxID=1070780 RepID=UPI0022FE88AE|nr:uncharacterized protein KD926_006340 [Aspergillus affinis]KAI9042003.1 hypothetical protein KD926_006340 [Aspergillus affinis]